MKTMMNKYELKRILLDFFFPNRCPVCNKVIGRMDYICNDCPDKLRYSDKEETLCGGRLISVCRYDSSTEPIVLGAKRNRDGSKLSFMAYTLMRKITDSFDTLPDVLLPVPIYHSDKVKKGYCHTEKICREITELTGIPTVTAVSKIKKTAQQKSRGREQRLVNLKGCFAVTNENALKGKHVLVIDDVTTTGSTLTEIHHTIENCDPAAVDFAVFART